jgi:hypothetical protein
VVAVVVTEAPSTRTRRTISYLTCTRSRASKNSEEPNCSSCTASRRGFSVRDSANAASFASGFRFRATVHLPIHDVSRIVPNVDEYPTSDAPRLRHSNSSLITTGIERIR